MSYNSRFDTNAQLELEEAVAAILFNHPYLDSERPSETDCQTLSRQILKAVATELRPDLIKSQEPRIETFSIANYIPHPEKHGYLKFVGNKTFNEVEAAVTKFLNNNSLNHYEWIVAGEVIPDNSNEPIPEYAELVFRGGVGNNEGWITQVGYLTKQQTFHNLLRIKHFEGLEYAFQLAQTLGKFLAD